MNLTAIIDALLATFSSDLVTLAPATAEFSPARPPAIPLAVKSPYLSTWLYGDAQGTLPGNWPKFWEGTPKGWVGLIRVDGTAYSWLGAAPGPELVSQKSFSYTATQSIFEFDVDGKVQMTVTFLSPVNPHDLEFQSLQFSYINVKVRSSDGNQHNVQVYMDCSGEWASGDANQEIEWDYGTTDGVAYHSFNMANQNVFQEQNDHAAWGDWYLATEDGDSMTRKSGPDVATREQFEKDGKLDNKKDTNFRSINDDWPVFAFAHDLGKISDSAPDTLFVIGLSQDKVIEFQGRGNKPSGLEGLWKSKWDSAEDAVAAFFNAYTDQLANSNKLDAQIHTDSVAAGGQNYSTITTLATRQAFGAYQLAKGSNQTYMFLKEISSNGDISTVDVIFPTSPLLLYTNPELLKLLLDPLFENQESGHYPNDYAIHDLGIFPRALGYPRGNDEKMPVEESGNMIAMVLAYAKATDNHDYIAQHWEKLKQWAAYLVNDSLVPSEQLSTDDFAGHLANQTNLALKGIISLKAMSKMADLTGIKDEYGKTADDFLTRWKKIGAINTKDNHTTLNYSEPNSHGLLYNLYNDRLLGLNFVSQDIYDMQSNFYTTIAKEYGVPLDTRHSWCKSDWQFFAAAVASDDTKKMFLDRNAKWINETKTIVPMTDVFDAETGDTGDAPGFKARPVVGATFALLALPKK